MFRKKPSDEFQIQLWDSLETLMAYAHLRHILEGGEREPLEIFLKSSRVHEFETRQNLYIRGASSSTFIEHFDAGFWIMDALLVLVAHGGFRMEKANTVFESHPQITAHTPISLIEPGNVECLLEICRLQMDLIFSDAKTVCHGGFDESIVKDLYACTQILRALGYSSGVSQFIEISKEPALWCQSFMQSQSGFKCPDLFDAEDLFNRAMGIPNSRGHACLPVEMLAIFFGHPEMLDHLPDGHFSGYDCMIDNSDDRHLLEAFNYKEYCPTQDALKQMVRLLLPRNKFMENGVGDFFIDKLIKGNWKPHFPYVMENCAWILGDMDGDDMFRTACSNALYPWMPSSLQEKMRESIQLKEGKKTTLESGCAINRILFASFRKTPTHPGILGDSQNSFLACYSGLSPQWKRNLWGKNVISLPTENVCASVLDVVLENKWTKSLGMAIEEGNVSFQQMLDAESRYVETHAVESGMLDLARSITGRKKASDILKEFEI